MYTGSLFSKRAALAAFSATVASVLVLMSPGIAGAEGACSELEQARNSAYNAYEASNARLKAQEALGRITSDQRFELDQASPEYKANMDAIRNHERCLGDAASAEAAKKKVVTGVVFGGLLLCATVVVGYALLRRGSKTSPNAGIPYTPKFEYHSSAHVPSVRGDIIDAEVVEPLERDGTSPQIGTPPPRELRQSQPRALE